jgi:GNAT superfamily N-acetyltransferase
VIQFIAAPRPEDLRTVTRALGYDQDAPAVLARLMAPPVGRRHALLATPGGDGVAAVSVSTRDPTVGHWDLLAVHPDARRQGLGRSLVAAGEEWFVRHGVRHARIAGNPPCYGWPGIDVRYTAAACLAEEFGYTLTRTAWNMTVDLSIDLDSTGDERRLAGEGIELRQVADRLRGPVSAFARQHWGDGWAWEVEQASGCHLAVRGGAILGFAAWGARPHWFGPMGTAESARGLGIGAVLLRRCLRDLRATGARHAEIGWVGPKRFYSLAVGAAVGRVFWQYGRDLPDGTG